MNRSQTSSWRRRQLRMRAQAGLATVEYAIGAVFVCLFLFTGNPSPLEQLLTSLRQNHSASTYAIGSPTVGVAK
ncbi:hypothetical protein [Xenophilus sp. Marseille-Q4582]|uniref:hypothetical protein n=1 Tax=Xenophilus sp. Marseille-Q4582 TaxID=2866600 RepID=UPI001CE44263|nr:hypothetical protein [Xenophilus sp. Marseille-Q4582]